MPREFTLSGRYKIRKTNKLESLQREKEKIEVFLSQVESEENKKDMAKAKVSLTDRDARMVKDKDTKYMGYNCQIAVDEQAHVIVGAEVFNDVSERGLLKSMVEETRNWTGDDFKKTEIGFDAGYFSSQNLKYCDEKKLNVYLPEGRGESGTKERKSKTIESRDCQLEIAGEIKQLTDDRKIIDWEGQTENGRSLLYHRTHLR